MKSWPVPPTQSLPGTAPAITIRDSQGRSMTPGADASLYVCGLTPYDATHLGHAFTYVCFDMLLRAWRDAGVSVTYAQNITDIDDPLFERATQTGVDWRELADSQIELFRNDMTALRVIPPNYWVAVSEIVDELETVTRQLEADGHAYRLNGETRSDMYARVSDSDLSAPHLQSLDVEQLFVDNGGDPDREGKEHRLDPMLWKGIVGDHFRVEGEQPGQWRPGWHIECALIARTFLGTTIDIQGGGRDLVFPHHEMSMWNIKQLGGQVNGQMNVGLVAYEGEKMSKSLGNLVRVSGLLERGYEAAAIRLLLIDQHWSTDWEYTSELMDQAVRRLTLWRRAQHQGGAGAAGLLERVRLSLADNLDTPRALAEIDEWVQGEGMQDDAEGSVLFSHMCDQLLGIKL